MEAAQIKEYPKLEAYLQKKDDPLATKIIETLFLCGQGDNFFSHLDQIPDAEKKLDDLIETLKPVESFYDVLGGIRAYHNEFQWLLDERKTKQKVSQFLLPVPTDITKQTLLVNRSIRKAVETMEHIAEMYPIGGAGDRFDLKDPSTGTPLPVAALTFRTHTLLEGLVRDLQGREYLCFKLRGICVVTPIAMMTSHEKNNHERIQAILEKANWFGRNKESFKLFIQPLVPVIAEDGSWIQSEPLKLVMKPGGHGVIWKIAHDTGVFEWFKQKNVTKSLIRQINNPIAGIDYGLLAFTGVGIENNKLFGFASCQRVINSAEGMNAVIENYYPSAKVYEYALSNIEYTNLEQEGIKDVPVRQGSRFSAYPCNTNILFADLATVEELCLKFPLPGMLINLKNSYQTLQSDGTYVEKRGGRMETTMQNISDNLIYSSSLPLDNHKRLHQYITYNERLKTISVTKHQCTKLGEIEHTPEGALRDFMLNFRDLLTQHCNFTLPPMETLEEYVKDGPSFYFDIHPAAGPLFSVIGQKIKNGTLNAGSELILEVAEVHIEQLELSGSLVVVAESPCGHFIDSQHLEYSHKGGKCSLVDVQVENKGIDRSATKQHWKGMPQRHEVCLIEIEGDGEFHAEGVTLKGDCKYKVPAGHRLEITQAGEKLTKIDHPTWWWDYKFLPDHSIKVSEGH